jgi:hypothetical protein
MITFSFKLPDFRIPSEESRSSRPKTTGSSPANRSYPRPNLTKDREYPTCRPWGQERHTTGMRNSRLLFSVRRLSFTLSTKYYDLSLLDDSNMFTLVCITVDFTPADVDVSLTDFPPASSETVLPQRILRERSLMSKCGSFFLTYDTVHWIPTTGPLPRFNQKV